MSTRGLGEFVPKPDKAVSFAALKTAIKKAGYTKLVGKFGAPQQSCVRRPLRILVVGQTTTGF